MEQRMRFHSRSWEIGMKYRIGNKRTLAAIVLGFVSLMAGFANAADLQRSGSYEGIDVTLIVGPTEITVGEPIALKIRITNVGLPANAPVFSSKLQLAEGNDIDVYLQPPGEAEVRLEGAVEPGIYSGTAIEVPPGRTVEHQIRLVYDNTHPNGYLFNAPGDYTIRVALRFSVSNAPDPRRLFVTGQIKVRAPEAEAADAFKQINDPKSAKALQLGIIPDDDLLHKFTEIGDKYPKTVYGKSCARAAALHLAYKKGVKVRTILPILLKYESTYRQESDTDQIAYTIAASYHVLGEHQTARDWIYYMIDQFPNSSYLRKQDPMYKYYFLDPAEQVFSFPWYLYDKPWISPGAKPPTSLKTLSD